MSKGNKLTKYIILMTVSIFILFTVGCEELLNQALNKDITVEEPLFDTSSPEAVGQEIDVAQNVALAGTQPLSKMAAVHMIPFDAPNAALFAWVMSEGGGVVRGQIQNLDAASALFKIYVGSTTDMSTAQVIGSVSVPGNQTTDFSFQGSDLSEYFESHFNAGWGTLYVFLSGEESSTINLLVNTLEFVLNPSSYLSRIIGPSTNYADYADAIQEITDYSLSGSIRNLSASPMTVLIRIKPTVETAGFTGLEVSFIIAPGVTFDLSTWASLFTSEELTALNTQFSAALNYLAVGSIKAELFMMTESPLFAEVVSIAMSGTITVGL